MFFTLRTIVEENRVGEVLAGGKATFNRIEDVYDALKWRLARRPESGTQVSPEGDHLIKTADLAVSGVPVLVALYRYDDNQVNIEAINIVPPNGR